MSPLMSRSCFFFTPLVKCYQPHVRSWSPPVGAAPRQGLILWSVTVNSLCPLPQLVILGLCSNCMHLPFWPPPSIDLHMFLKYNVSKCYKIPSRCYDQSLSSHTARNDHRRKSVHLQADIPKPAITQFASTAGHIKRPIVRPCELTRILAKFPLSESQQSHASP